MLMSKWSISFFFNLQLSYGRQFFSFFYLQLFSLGINSSCCWHPRAEAMPWSFHCCCYHLNLVGGTPRSRKVPLKVPLLLQPPLWMPLTLGEQRAWHIFQRNCVVPRMLISIFIFSTYFLYLYPMGINCSIDHKTWG
jgi:hypothetical protein